MTHFYPSEFFFSVFVHLTFFMTIQLSLWLIKHILDYPLSKIKKRSKLSVFVLCQKDVNLFIGSRYQYGFILLTLQCIFPLNRWLNEIFNIPRNKGILRVSIMSPVVVTVYGVIRPCPPEFSWWTTFDFYLGFLSYFFH